MALALGLSGFAVAPATAQTPVAPGNGARVTSTDVVLRWQLDSGWGSECVQWAARPETSYAGGPFLAPDNTVCNLGPRDEAYLMRDLDVRRYYWHIEAEREVCGPDANGYQDCRVDDTWGPTAYFDSVAPPPPPPPKTCRPGAADVMGNDVLIPYAEKHYRRYYRGITEWSRRGPVCRDLDRDGDAEMIVRMQCCTAGSLSPWAVFKHDRSGNWRMVYAQIRDTVWALAVRHRVVRTMVPAPYEGACTRYVRYRLVSSSGGRFRSRLTGRRRIHPC
jgi:hypothetical protein